MRSAATTSAGSAAHYTPNAPSPRFLDCLSKVDTAIEDLTFRHELSENNVQGLTKQTRRLYNDLLDNKERAKIASDLRNLVDQILSFSATGDQILTLSEDLQRRFPEKLHNISFDFTNFRAFKYLALKDALDSLNNLSSHGYRCEVQPILTLTELRMIQWTLHSTVNSLQESISEMMIRDHKMQNPDDLSREKFTTMMSDLDLAKQETVKFSDKYHKTKQKLKKERELRETITLSLQNAREDFERERIKWGMERERKERELASLGNVAHDHFVLQCEMESLRAQLAVERERVANLQTKYQALKNGRDGSS
jgi:hypothetical protein